MQEEKTSEKKSARALPAFFPPQCPLLLQSPFIQLSAREGVYNVQLKHILYCSSDNSLATFHLAQGARLMVSKPLKHFEALLRSFGFARAHSKHLVNLTRIACCRHTSEGRHVLELSSGEKIPVSRTMKKNLLQALSRISVSGAECPSEDRQRMQGELRMPTDCSWNDRLIG